MGRGRAKAKQTKVARDLKYRTHETDFGELARELHGSEASAPPPEPVETPADVGPETGDVDEYDEWADYSESNGGPNGQPSGAPNGQPGRRE